MPHVAITIAEGRTPTQIRNLLHEVHAAILRTANTRPEHIRVVVHEVPRTHWATGDLTLTEMNPAGASRTCTRIAGNHSGQDAARRPVTTADEEQP